MNVINLIVKLVKLYLTLFFSVLVTIVESFFSLIGRLIIIGGIILFFMCLVIKSSYIVPFIVIAIGTGFLMVPAILTMITKKNDWNCFFI